MLTPLQPLHLSGPLHQRRNLLFRWRRGDPAPRSLGSVVYLWRKASTNGNLNHSGCHHRNALTYGRRRRLRGRRLCHLRLRRMKFEARLRNVAVMASR
jgi:hypothetical protein